MQFPNLPPRYDMKNWQYLYRQSTPEALETYLGKRPDLLVGCEIPLGPSARNHFDVRVPDLMVSLDCDLDRVIAEKGYSLETQSKPPDFILDIAPGFAFRSDYAARRLDFARYGVREYWRFDGGDAVHAARPAALEGERLVNGKYEPIPVEWLDAGALTLGDTAKSWACTSAWNTATCASTPLSAKATCSPTKISRIAPKPPNPAPPPRPPAPNTRPAAAPRQPAAALRNAPAIYAAKNNPPPTALYTPPPNRYTCNQNPPTRTDEEVRYGQPIPHAHKAKAPNRH